MRPVGGGANPGRGIPILGSAIAQLPRTTITPGIEFALFVNCQGVQSIRGNSLPIGRGLNSGRGSSIGRGAVAQSAAKVTSPAVEFPFLVNSETAGACCGNSGPLRRHTPYRLPAVPGIRSGFLAACDRPSAHPHLALMADVKTRTVIETVHIPGRRPGRILRQRRAVLPAVPIVRSRLGAVGDGPLAHPDLVLVADVKTRPVIRGSGVPGRGIGRRRRCGARRADQREKRHRDDRHRESAPQGTPVTAHGCKLLVCFVALCWQFAPVRVGRPDENAEECTLRGGATRKVILRNVSQKRNVPYSP